MASVADVAGEVRRHIDGIDGLRAIAVLSVILYHVQASAMPGGFSGVDIFFVISGYVVTGSLVRHRIQGLAAYALAFYARRIRRIFPALVTCALVSGIAQVLLVPAAWLSTASYKTGIAALLGVSNIALIWFDDGYFSPRVEFNPFTHTWSLAVEEQFYLLFPLLLFFWQKAGNSPSFAGRLSRAAIPAACVLSLLLCAWQSTAHPDSAYYLLGSRFWELGAGGLLFMLHSKGRWVCHSARSAGACVTAGLLLIAAGFLFADPHLFPFPWALASVAGACMAIAGATVQGIGAAQAPWACRALCWKPLVGVGKLSYSLYLWHWPVLVMFRWTVGAETALSRVLIVLIVLITVALSWLSFRFVEVPWRRGDPARARSDARVVTVGAASVGAAAVLLAGVFLAQPLLSLSVTRDRQVWYPEAWPTKPDPEAVVPALAGKRLFAFGDSHTDAYATLLKMLEDQQGLSTLRFKRGGCSIATLLAPAQDGCAAFIDETVRTITAQARPGDVVFLASLRMKRLGDQWKTFDAGQVQQALHSEAAAADRAAALAQADQLISRFEAAGLVVVMDAPKPVFPSPPFRCSDVFNRGNPACQAGFSVSREWLLNHRALGMQSIEALKVRHPKLQVWDPFEVLCPAPTCFAFRDGQPLFFDGDHLSAYGNRALYGSFVAMLEYIWKVRHPAP